MTTRHLVLVTSSADWHRRFGHLPPDKLRGWDGEGLYCKRTGDYCGTQRAEVCAPSVIRDIPDHIGPSGRLITSRSWRRDEFKRTGTCEWEPVTNMPRGLANETFARKYGGLKKGGLLHLDDKCQAWMDSEIDKIEDGLAPVLSGKVKPKPKKMERMSPALEAEVRHVLAKHGIND